ncbi:MAG: hypothetical protein ACKVPX_00795 [Myxococcaceae bacterium]
MLKLLVLLTAFPAMAESWTKQEEKEGVLLETREVAQSAFEEIRVTTLHAASVGRICDAIWGGNTRVLERGFKKRETLEETETERWTYERVSAPLARDRDYTIHVKREAAKDDGCRVAFDVQNDKGPPPQQGVVRVPAIRGQWEVSRDADQRTRVVYTVYSEPGGRVPAFLARGGQRSSALEWMKTILSRAQAHASL